MNSKEAKKELKEILDLDYHANREIWILNTKVSIEILKLLENKKYKRDHRTINGIHWDFDLYTT